MMQSSLRHLMKVIPSDWHSHLQPVKHAGPYFRGSADHPKLYRYMSIGPFATEEDFVSGLIEGIVNAQSSDACFAVIGKRKPPSPADPEGELASMISYMALSAVSALVG